MQRGNRHVQPARAVAKIAAKSDVSTRRHLNPAPSPRKFRRGISQLPTRHRTRRHVIITSSVRVLLSSAVLLQSMRDVHDTRFPDNPPARHGAIVILLRSSGIASLVLCMRHLMLPSRHTHPVRDLFDTQRDLVAFMVTRQFGLLEQSPRDNGGRRSPHHPPTCVPPADLLNRIRLRITERHLVGSTSDPA